MSSLCIEMVKSWWKWPWLSRLRLGEGRLSERRLGEGCLAGKGLADEHQLTIMSSRYGKFAREHTKMRQNSLRLVRTSMMPSFDHSYKIQAYGREQQQIPMWPHNKKDWQRYVPFSSLVVAKVV